MPKKRDFSSIPVSIAENMFKLDFCDELISLFSLLVDPERLRLELREHAQFFQQLRVRILAHVDHRFWKRLITHSGLS
jgi:hypothetical protein